MNFTANDDRSLKQYLFDELAPDEQTRIEERLLTDTDYTELLLVVEQELIDSYVSNEMSAHDRKRFEKNFLSTPERRRKLRLARALRRYVSTQTGTELLPSPIPEYDFWKRLGQWRVRWLPASALVAVFLVCLSIFAWRPVSYQINLR